MRFNPKVTGVFGVILIGGAAAYYFASVRPRHIEEQQREECLNNLKMMEGAMASTALEKNLHRGDPIKPEWIASFLRGNRLPECPSGGSYTIPGAGGIPSCSYHGNLPGPPDPRTLGIPNRPTNAPPAK